MRGRKEVSRHFKSAVVTGKTRRSLGAVATLQRWQNLIIGKMSWSQEGETGMGRRVQLLQHQQPQKRGERRKMLRGYICMYQYSILNNLLVLVASNKQLTNAAI